jgi:hypothetical protein
MENLKEIRNEMLRLHKILMDLERTNYELKHGKITNVQLLNLLFEDENFTWLRELSSLVSEVDELFAAKNGVDNGLANKLFDQAKALFDESESNELFKKKYQANLDTETEVAFHHIKLLKLLAK